MFLPVEHERFRHSVVSFLHQRHLHLVLYILHRDAIVDIEVSDNLAKAGQVDWLIHRLKRLDYGIHYFVERKADLLSITLGYAKRNILHGN